MMPDDKERGGASKVANDATANPYAPPTPPPPPAPPAKMPSARIVERMDGWSGALRRGVGPKLRWIALGSLALGLTTLASVSRLLGSIESAGQRSFDANVFTGLKLRFWDTSALEAAIALWQATPGSPTGPFRPEWLIGWHNAIDAVVFVPAYCALIWWLLGRFGASERVAWTTALVTAAADWLETAATWLFLVGGDLHVSRDQLRLLQALTLLKWVAIAWSVGTILVLWRRQYVRDGGYSLRGRGTLASLTVLAALFGAAVALPAGGPLDQIPDVLRSQFSTDATWTTRILSVVALVLLAGSVATGAALAADPSWERAPRRLVRNRRMLIVAAALSGVLALLTWILDGSVRVPTLAPLLVVVLIWAAAKVAVIAGAADRGVDAQPLAPVSLDASRVAAYAGALAGVVILAGGAGLVRAAFPAAILGLPSGVLPWWLVTLMAALVTVLGGLVAQWIVLKVLAEPTDDPTVAAVWRHERVRRRWGGAIALATCVAVVLLTAYPGRGRLFGTTGVVAIGFAATALLAGVLAWLARERIAWEATQTLGIGVRTPWLGLVALTWMVASLLNTDGIYHDARVLPRATNWTPRYADLPAAFAAWERAQQTVGCAAPGADVPLVMIAAPGGGIRAAYWTAAALDSLFGSRGARCATTPIFAMSSVSGGSVGVTTWLGATAAGRAGRGMVSAMSVDGALAAAAAGLFFRDALQPFVGIATRWRDRAALLEDEWASARAVDGPSALARLSWDSIGEPLPWVPVVALNGSSVTDGCRVLVTNVGALPAETQRGCTEHPRGGAGPVTGSIDGLAQLVGRSGTNVACGHAGVRAVTAALLSARFPVVSPSGALLRCIPRETSIVTPGASSGATSPSRPDTAATYVVDGGYTENSGILTLLQIWSVVDPLVRAHNADSARARIVPWLLVLDNHYRSTASAPQPRRPLELVVPITALSSANVAGQGALEQMAWAALPGDAAGCGPRPGAASGDSTVRGCVAVLAPMVEPAVSAPLGWVLSEMSRANLDAQLASRLNAAKAESDHRDEVEHLRALRALLATPAVRR